jgi:hypothetical protein
MDLPVEVLGTVGVLLLLIGYHMVIGPTCGDTGDSGSIGVTDNDCDNANRFII